MNQRKICRYIDWCIIIVFSACIFGVSTTTPLWDKVFPLAPLIVFLALGVLFLNHISIKNCFQTKDKEFFLMVGGIILSMINMICVRSRVGAIFTIADFLLVVYLADKVRFDKAQLGVIAATCFFIWFYWQFINKDVYDSTSFNPNTPPIFMFTFFCVFISYFFCFWPNALKDKKWLYPLIALLFVILTAKRSLDFRCRGVIIALSAWTFTYLFLPKKKITVSLVIGLSLLFPVVYVLLSESGAVDGIMIYGKNFASGRDVIWYEFFQVFIHHPITGIGSNFDLMLPNLTSPMARSAHHSLLNLLFIHGLPVFLIALYLMYKRIEHVITCSSEFAKNICIASIYGMLTIGTFDNAYILSPYNMMFMTLFIIANTFVHEPSILQEP